MAKQFDQITEDHRRFIDAQHIFFCGTAADQGRVNISPKGMDCLRILGPNRIIWRNLSGSGNETAGHLLHKNRITLMWCSFEARPMIMRAYGKAKTLHPRDAGFATLNARFEQDVGARQIFDITVDLLQTSCGYAVPFYNHIGPRDTLKRQAKTHGADGVAQRWARDNQTTIDGLPTDILDTDDA
ncbi:pyridoxamine 5'-phosphate oxidase family protein [Sulfitobacter sp. F26204]|nr:pyridoxamine 5'-phosphate oxidase family protein [Sulfitobacter sp. F26204]